MSAASTVYNALFKRTSTFALTVAVGTFFFERTFDVLSETIFDRINEGKLWNHIKNNYEN